MCVTQFSLLEFLCEIVEILLYILLPDEDFQCKPLRYVLREIFANCVILPLFNLVSDPDYINQVIIWLVSLPLLFIGITKVFMMPFNNFFQCLQENQLPSDIFLTSLRLTDNCDELKSIKELVSKEVHSLVSQVNFHEF